MTDRSPLDDRQLDMLLGLAPAPPVAPGLVDRIVAEAQRPGRTVLPTPRRRSSKPRRWTRRAVWTSVLAVNLVLASAVAAAFGGGVLTIPRIAVVVQHLADRLRHPLEYGPAPQPHHAAPRSVDRVVGAVHSVPSGFDPIPVFTTPRRLLLPASDAAAFSRRRTLPRRSPKASFPLAKPPVAAARTFSQVTGRPAVRGHAAMLRRMEPGHGAQRSHSAHSHRRDTSPASVAAEPEPAARTLMPATDGPAAPDRQERWRDRRFDSAGPPRWAARHPLGDDGRRPGWRRRFGGPDEGNGFEPRRPGPRGPGRPFRRRRPF